MQGDEVEIPEVMRAGDVLKDIRKRINNLFRGQKFKEYDELRERILVDIAYEALYRANQKRPTKTRVFELITKMARDFYGSVTILDALGHPADEYGVIEANFENYGGALWRVNRHIKAFEVNGEVNGEISEIVDKAVQYLIRKKYESDEEPGILIEYGNGYIRYVPGDGIYRWVVNQRTGETEEYAIYRNSFEIMQMIDATAVAGDVFYRVKIGDHEDIMTFDDLVKYMIKTGLADSRSKRIESELKHILSLIVGYLRNNVDDFAIRITKETPVAPGVWDIDGRLEVLLTRDHIWTFTKEQEKVLTRTEEIVEKLKQVSDDDLLFTVKFVLEILRGFNSTTSRVNSILVLSHLGISPFYHLLMKNERMAKYLLLYGDKGSGKTWKTNIILYAFGKLKEAGGDVLKSTFRTAQLLSSTTFPVVVDDVVSISHEVLGVMKSISGGKPLERGTASQKIKNYPPLASLVITANDAAWEALNEEGVYDRWIIGRVERRGDYQDRYVKIVAGKRTYEGRMSSADILFVKTVPWGILLVKDIIERLNSAAESVGMETLDLFLMQLSKLRDTIIDIIMADESLKGTVLNSEYEFSRLTKFLSEYYWGFVNVVEFFEKVLGDEIKEYGDMEWLFSLKNIGKYVKTMVKEWLEYSYNIDVIKGIINEVEAYVSALNAGRNSSTLSKYSGLIIYKENEYVALTTTFLHKYAESHKLKKLKTDKVAEELAKAIREILGAEDWLSIRNEIAGNDGYGKTIWDDGKKRRGIKLKMEYFEALVNGVWTGEDHEEDEEDVILFRVEFLQDYEDDGVRHKVGSVGILREDKALMLRKKKIVKILGEYDGAD